MRRHKEHVVCETAGWIWLAGLLVGVFLLQGCQSVEQGVPDLFPPHSVAIPAGGVYPSLPPEIRLLAEADATLYYHWGNEAPQPYSGPITPPADTSNHRILSFWAQDGAGNREPLRREHYVLAPEAAYVEIVGPDRFELGPAERVMLRWRSTVDDGAYEIAVTQRGWGPGRPVAKGRVIPGIEQHTPIAAAALLHGENRLWLRVRRASGAMGATSRLLTLYRKPTTTHAWPAGGRFGSPQTVQLFSKRAATIYYTIDGSQPTLQSARYTSPIRIERSTRLRYFSVDAYGNRETPQQGDYEVRQQAPSITLLTLSGYTLSASAPFTFNWRSDTAGRYEVVLTHPQRREVTVQQGEVRRKQEVRSHIAAHFFSLGKWQVLLRVTSEQGVVGQLSLPVQVRYGEFFANDRFSDAAASSAIWDTEQQHVRLGRGPHLVATYKTRGRSRQVRRQAQYAYLANGKGGLHIVDVARPEDPRRVGLFYPHGKAVALAKYSHYIYLASGASGLSVVDVAQPTTPTLVATLPLRGAVTDVRIVAPSMYVGTKQGVLYIFDLAEPLRPRRLGQVAVDGHIVDIAAADGMVYLACLNQGVIIVDAHTPHQARLVGHWPTRNAATGIALHAQRAYVAAGGLEVLDVQRPSAPRRQRFVRMGGAYGVALWPPVALIAAGSDGVHVLPMNGSGFGFDSIPTAHYAARFAVMGDHLLVADTRGGLRLFDMTQPEQPRFVAQLDEIGAIVDVVVDGAFAYLADDRHGSGLVVVDLSTPTVPRVVGRYVNELTTDVALWRHWALLSDAAGVLQMVDVQQPARPRLHSSLKLPGKPHRIALQPPYALIASDTAGVQVVDVSQPLTPLLGAAVPITGRALDIAVAHGVAYVAAAQGGVQAIDLGTPLAPRLMWTYHHPDGKGDDVIRLLVDGQMMYAIDSERGLQILALEPDGSLQLRGQADMPRGAPWGVATVGPYVFVTTLLNALYVFDVSDPSRPHLIHTAPYGGAALVATGRYLYIAVRGSRGTPGGLRIVEAFAAVTEKVRQSLQQLGIASLSTDLPGQAVVNRAYVFNTPGLVQSSSLPLANGQVRAARLRVDDFWHQAGHIDYMLSNNGGTTWQLAQPGQPVSFAEPGADLRWRARLRSTNPTLTPTVQAVWIDDITIVQSKP